MTDDQALTSETSLSFECSLAEPPEKVWRALTVPELVSAWLAPNDLTPEPGAHFTLKNGSADKHDVACEILAADPCRTLRYRWRTEAPDGSGVDSIVTFTLRETERGGTHLRIVHDDFVALETSAAAAPALRIVARSDRFTTLSPKRVRALSPARGARRPHMLMAA